MKIVRSVSFDANAVSLAYMDEATDVRAEGAVFQAHTITLYRDNDLDDEIAAVETAVDDLLKAAISTWASTLPFDVVEAERRRYDEANEDEDDD